MEETTIQPSDRQMGIGELLSRTQEAVKRNPIMAYFEWGHLPEKLRTISKPIGNLAVLMDEALPQGPEKSAGLRKLLEAKDCFVRAAL
jgi:hypothetical protein